LLTETNHDGWHIVSEPRAVRGPRAGSPRGVVDATGSGGNLEIQRDFLIRSLPLAVLTRCRYFD